MGGRATQGFGLLLVGGAIGEAVARLTQADWLLVGAVLLAGLAFIGGGAWLEKRKRRQGRIVAAAQVTRVNDMVNKGWGVLNEMIQWSFVHPYRADPSGGYVPVVGRAGQEMRELLRKAAAWKAEADELVMREFGTAILRFGHAVPMAPSRDVAVHPHVESEWASVRGRMAWLSNNVPWVRIVSPGDRRSRLQSTRDRLLRRPSLESEGKD